MSEIIFVVESAPEGGYSARTLGESIFTQAETIEELHQQVRDAVRCHFDDGNAPKMIRLHFVRDEVIACVKSSESDKTGSLARAIEWPERPPVVHVSASLPHSMVRPVETDVGKFALASVRGRPRSEQRPMGQRLASAARPFARGIQ